MIEWIGIVLIMALFFAAGVSVGISLGVDSIKRSLNRRLQRFHDDDELSVRLIKELIEEA
ncbi:MAG: hypothetical protein II008_02670 [Oscillospiraceae bacterium]|nr:hypothetical protein [Oscillospiraceae bacterium]